MLQEELRLITLESRFLGRPNKIKDEIELREQKKKNIDNIEILNVEMKEREFKSVKILQGLYYKKWGEIFGLERIELRLERLWISRETTDNFKKLIIRKKYLHFVSHY